MCNRRILERGAFSACHNVGDPLLYIVFGENVSGPNLVQDQSCCVSLQNSVSRVPPNWDPCVTKATIAEETVSTGKMVLRCLPALGVVLLVLHVADSGILDWARSDKIEVNLPWLPCEYFYPSSKWFISKLDGCSWKRIEVLWWPRMFEYHQKLVSFDTEANKFISSSEECHQDEVYTLYALQSQWGTDILP